MREGGIKSTLPLRSAQPLYKQIERNMVQCLANGEWKAGEQLPTESELAKRFGVAIYTVRAGILTRKQGKGTFVARHERDHTRQVLTKIFDDQHRQIIPTSQKVNFFRKQLADERARSLLSLDQRQKSHVYH